tara:strand:- start:4018 stop:5007 length:990 start_codon:yes stop_codon:yes gene_type:complete
MAMTLDKLFNFDEQTLARQVMNENKYKAQAAADKNGWGNTVAGFSRLTDNVIGPGGILGVKDPLLEKSSKIESILSESSSAKNEDGTNMSPLQMQKVILNRMQQDPSLGKESLMLAEKIANDEATTSKIEYDRAIKEIQLGNTLDVAQTNRDDKYARQSDRIVKQVERKVIADPYFWRDEIKSVLRGDEWFSSDFEGDTTGAALEELTMKLIDARKTDANGNATGLMFNGLQQALDTAKKIIKDSNPETGLTWWNDDKINKGDITKLAINEISRRNGRPENLVIGSDKEGANEVTPVGPEGTTFVEMTPDGRAVFKYPDGREVVAKGSN